MTRLNVLLRTMLILALGSLACGLTNPASPTPDAGSAEARPVTLRAGESQVGKFEAGAVGEKSFVVDIAAGKALQIVLKGTNQEKLIVAVTGPDGTVVATKATATGDSTVYTTEPLPGGSYTVTLTSDGSVAIDYEIVVDAIDPGGSAGGDAGAAATPATGSTPVALATGTALPEGWEAESACDHPYWPIRQGASWTYSGTSEGAAYSYTVNVVSISGDLDEAQAVLEAVYTSEVTFTATWNFTCSAERGLSSYDFFGNSGMSVEGMTMTGDFSGEGQLLLPAEQLVPGASWAVAFAGEMTMSAGDDLTMTGTSSYNFNNTVSAVGPVDVEGGNSYSDSVTVTQTGTVSTEINAAGISAPGVTVDISGTRTYARGVGPVSDIFAGGSATLVSYTIP
jgi:hypothetical protein